MAKININPVDSKGNLVSEHDMVSAAVGILHGLHSLANLRSAVRKVEASYIDENNGFRMIVHFADPLGNESYHATDYRFIGNKSPKPSAQEIMEQFSDPKSLRVFIRDFLVKSRHKLNQAEQELERQIGA